MIVKEGSKWSAGVDKVFHVLSVVEIEDHTWVHYIEDSKVRIDGTLNGEREYSCYIESFLQRFRPIPE